MSNPAQSASELLATMSHKTSDPNALKSLTWDKCKVRMENGQRIVTHLLSVTMTEIPYEDYKLIYPYNFHISTIYFMLFNKLSEGYYTPDRDMNFGEFWVKLKDSPDLKHQTEKATDFVKHVMSYNDYIRNYFNAAIKMNELIINPYHQNLSLKWIKEGKITITANI